MENFLCETQLHRKESNSDYTKDKQALEDIELKKLTIF